MSTAQHSEKSPPTIEVIPQNWPFGTQERWPEGVFAEDGSGVKCLACTKRKAVFIDTHHPYALRDWKLHAELNRHYLNSITRVNVVEEKKLRLSCDGVVPCPEKTEILSRTMLYKTYSLISDSSPYIFGTTPEGIPTIFTKDCTNSGLKRKFGYACDTCFSFRSKKWRDLRKILSQCADKYTSALEALRSPRLSLSNKKHLRAVAATPDRYLSEDGRELKQECRTALDTRDPEPPKRNANHDDDDKAKKKRSKDVH
jgi:hypothetical protein